MTHGKDLFSFKSYLLFMISTHHHHTISSDCFPTFSDLFGDKRSLKIVSICTLIDQLVKNIVILCAPCTRLDFFLSVWFSLSPDFTLFFFNSVPAWCYLLLLCPAFGERNNAAQNRTAQERSWRRGKKTIEKRRSIDRDLWWCWNSFYFFLLAFLVFWHFSSRI